METINLSTPATALRGVRGRVAVSPTRWRAAGTRVSARGRGFAEVTPLSAHMHAVAVDVPTAVARQLAKSIKSVPPTRGAPR